MQTQPKTAAELVEHFTWAVECLYADEAGNLPEGGRWVFALEGGGCLKPNIWSNIEPEELPTYVEGDLTGAADNDDVSEHWQDGPELRIAARKPLTAQMLASFMDTMPSGMTEAERWAALAKMQARRAALAAEPIFRPDRD